MTRLTKRGLMAVLILAGTLGLTGCFNDKPHQRGGEMMFEYMAWKLDLTDEQQLLLGDVREEMQKIRKQHREQRAQDKETLIALINADTLDTATAMTLVRKKQTMITDNAPAVLEKVAALHATLTPEQKEIITEKLNKMGRHRH